jgi:NifU-like protein involved in Fe-S cluster formation
MDYSSEVLRRFAAPLRAGELAEDTPGRVSGEAEDRSLNIWVRFDVQVQGGCIRAARFRVVGCPHAVAAAAWVADWLEGRGAEALAQLDIHAIARTLEVPTEKLGKLLRIEDALLACRRELEAGMATKGSE